MVVRFKEIDDEDGDDDVFEPAKIEQLRNSGKSERSCDRCHEKFEVNESYYLLGATSWHMRCFLCAQCMCPLIGDTYYQFEDRMYCEHDFNTLYAPICSKCDDFIIGHVIRSANCHFHAKCFTCVECQSPLDTFGAYRYNSKLYCFDCNQLNPKSRIYNCNKCKQPVDDSDLLMYQSEPYHAYHFNCTDCKKQLDINARTIKNQLYCPRCFDLKCDVCFDCKTVIDSQKERSIYCLDKHWHLEHFRCATCFRPFNGHEHYEKNGKAYCKSDFLALIGNHCFNCDKLVAGSVVHVFGKTFCPDCYRCRGCDKILHHKDKVMEYDMLPLCKKCIGCKTFQKALKDKAKPIYML